MFELIPFSHRIHSNSVYDPFEMFNEMEKNLFKNANTAYPIRTDVKDNGTSYELTADLPGCAKEDISIDVEDDVLTISATRSSEAEEKKKDYVRVERTYGKLARSFDVSGVDTDAITASYENGVLKLVLPKKEEEKPKAKKVEIV